MAEAVGKLAASTPAYWHGRLFVTSLSREDRRAAARNGKVLWQKTLAQPDRVLADRATTASLYFGTEGGGMYALYAKTGRVKWKFGTRAARSRPHRRCRAARSMSATTAGGCTPSGRAPAAQRWSTGTSGSKFGFASGRFYSTPAVGFGRVYAGNTDGKVYSFGASDRRARLVEVDRRLRLLVAGHRQRPGPRTDRLHRLLRREPVRARRPHGIGSLDRERRRPHLRRASP